MPKKISEDITRYLKKSCDMEHIVFDLNKDNVESSADAMMNFFDSVYPNAFNNIISQMTFYAFISNSNDFELYLAFMKSLENKEKDIVPNDYEIIETFIHFIDSIDSFDTYYIIEKLIEHNLYKFKKISRRYTYKRIYFAHYLSNSEIQGIRKEMCINKILKNLNLLHNNPIYNFFRNIEELSKNDWELHKKLIKEGENPNEIAKVIRNDEIEKLQEISSQPNFDFNQIIEPSLYERCSFINKDNVTLIDYAAFFSSVKCFKYLLMNNAKVENTGKYAVAGGNEEIIHLCEQNHSSFEYAYETAIQFHRNDIFKYLYEKKLDKQNYYCYFYKQLLINSEKDYKNLLEIKCIQYSNYELFSYLNQNNEINIDIINEFAESGNLYLINCYFKNNKIPKDILISASKSGNVELVKYFIEEKGMNVNTKSDNQVTPLIAASEKGHVDIVKYLLNQDGIKINEYCHGNTALMLAVKESHSEIVKLLLQQKGIYVYGEHIEDPGETELSCACINGDIETVKMLLDLKSFALGNGEKTEIAYAIKFGYFEIVKLLLDYEYDENDFRGKRKALINAIEYGQIEIAKYLIEKNEVDINYKNESYDFRYNDGCTALMMASRKGKIEIVKLLLEQEGIDINAKDNIGWTAFMYASENGHTEIVKLLLEQEGIDINAENSIGKTALLIASSEGRTEIVKLLLEQEGIDINAKDKYGKTALIWASENGHIEIVKLLLEQEGIDINAKDNNKETAFILASKYDKIEIVNLLLEQEGIDINANDIDGKTALIWASENGHIEIVKLLLEQEGIDINAKDKDGNTALMFTSEKGYINIVELLLEQENIDINAHNLLGISAIFKAAKRKHKNIVDILKKKEGIEYDEKELNKALRARTKRF